MSATLTKPASTTAYFRNSRPAKAHRCDLLCLHSRTVGRKIHVFERNRTRAQRCSTLEKLPNCEPDGNSH